MSLSEAEQAMDFMESIEDLKARFDVGKARHYMSLIKEFVSRSERYRKWRGLPLCAPFIDPTEQLQIVLPDPLASRLRDWEAGPSGRNPYAVIACRSKIRYLAARESLPPDERELVDIYEPLMQLLAEGATFYMDNGDLTVPDAGTLILPRN